MDDRIARRSSSVNFDSIRTLATGGGPSETAGPAGPVLPAQLLVVVDVILVISIKVNIHSKRFCYVQFAFLPMSSFLDILLDNLQWIYRPVFAATTQVNKLEPN